MAVYLDTSILVSAFVEDDHSDRVAVFLTGRRDLVVSSWAEAEFSSALGVRTRSGALSNDDRAEAEDVFDGWLAGQTACRLDELDIIRSRTLLRDGARLRTPDALHLAVVLRHGYGLATLDHDLGRAARLKGVEMADL